MEKTLARALYKLMKIGETYSTADIRRLLGDDYYKYIPEDMHPFQPNSKPVNIVITKELWKIVNQGYAKTYTVKELLPVIRGIKFGTKPTCYQSYNIRYWVRTK